MGDWDTLALELQELRLELQFRSLIAGIPFESRRNPDNLNTSIFSVVSKPKIFLPKQFALLYPTQDYTSWYTRLWALAKDIWEIRCEVFHFEPLPDQLVTTHTKLPYNKVIKEFISIVKKS